MRQLILELDDDVYQRLEILSARDDDRIKDGVERFLTELVAAHEGKRMPVIIYTEKHRTIQKEFGS